MPEADISYSRRELAAIASNMPSRDTDCEFACKCLCALSLSLPFTIKDTKEIQGYELAELADDPGWISMISSKLVAPNSEANLEEVMNILAWSREDLVRHMNQLPAHCRHIAEWRLENQ